MKIQSILQPAFWLTATLFVLLLPATPYPGDFFLKALPVACLVALVITAADGSRQRQIVAALVFSAVGDVSLELGCFTFGLAAFLVGHLFYLMVFWRAIRPSRSNSLPILGLLVYGVAIITWLHPYLGEMKLAVYLYMAVITSMAAVALLGQNNHPLVGLGALMFVVSDSLIAINRFIEPFEGARYGIMVLYYLAQYFLTWDARSGNYSRQDA